MMKVEDGGDLSPSRRRKPIVFVVVLVLIGSAALTLFLVLSGRSSSSSSSPSVECCSTNAVDCESTDSICNASREQCDLHCEGAKWITVPSANADIRSSSLSSSMCSMQSQSCTSESECCDGMLCEDGLLPNSSATCQPKKCCSWNFKACSISRWCNQNADVCHTNCGAYWINEPVDGMSCKARWESCDDDEEDDAESSSSSCCPSMQCTTRGTWKSCQPIEDEDGRIVETVAPTDAPTDAPSTGPLPTGSPTGSPTGPPITTTPTRFPTVSPTVSPTSAPTKLPTSSPTLSPITTNPTLAPTSAPVTANPTSAPTGPPVTANPTASPTIGFPSGDYITASNAHERVIIPDPEEPVIPEQRTNCPHEESGLTEWSFTGNSDVTIPENTRVIIRSSVAAQQITIPDTSELIIGETSPIGIIEIHATGFDVRGKLTMGSPTCRIETPITITLHGNRPADAVTNRPPITAKGISVNGGVLNIHGKRFYRTWTRLALTVEEGDDVLMLQNAVNWEPGQEIVLITTAMKDSREWHRNEVAIVKQVIPNPLMVGGEHVGAAVFLEEPVKYQHLATSNYQGEVGLLTRTIKIQGDEASIPTDPDPMNCHDSNRKGWGDTAVPCPNSQLTGYGGHVIMHNGARGYVQGLELYRMGQTNVLGRYPMHFHLLADGCEDCYFRDSSIHESFYRCISIHGTNSLHVAENVAYDVTGFCYYLEDGVEINNRIEFNLGAHIHMLGDEPPWGRGQEVTKVRQSDILTLPADIAAAAFYITNIGNHIIGNVAVGGWAGFAFPHLKAPIGLHRHVDIIPQRVNTLTLDGNTAHSTGWWWEHASGFYFGGSLKYVTQNGIEILEYNAGRDKSVDRKAPSALRVTNSKVFLASGAGLGSWTGRYDIIGFECHDCGLSMESLSKGFWITNMLSVCRTNKPMMMPDDANPNFIPADGFVWYDTNMEHIITDSTFRNCGYRSDEYDQYDNNSDRGCSNEPYIGCSSQSSVFVFTAHSDQFNPEIMQATSGITFENCGRRFRMKDHRRNAMFSSVSSRVQNWLDADGSITGLGERSVAVSGLSDAGLWWQADEDVVYEPQAPLWFYSLETGTQRGLGHVTMWWDSALHNRVGSQECSNGNAGISCWPHGYVKHLGERYADDTGLPVTANADVVGPVGGFGWKLELNGGAPKYIKFNLLEIEHDTPLYMSIAYPKDVPIRLVARSATWCVPSSYYSCTVDFTQVDSLQAVRESNGDTFYVDDDGVVTFRIVQTPYNFVGAPDFFIPDYSRPGKWGRGVAVYRYEKEGIILPVKAYGPWLELIADCASSDGIYCDGDVVNYNPDVCGDGYTQTGYDTCTSDANPKIKKYADGTILEL